jgi:DNA-binding transcriptional MerR regulator
MKIGELAQVAQTRVETVRYDEKEGLLAATARTAGNFRVHGLAAMETEAKPERHTHVG